MAAPEESVGAGAEEEEEEEAGAAWLEASDEALEQMMQVCTNKIWMQQIE